MYICVMKRMALFVLVAAICPLCGTAVSKSGESAGASRLETVPEVAQRDTVVGVSFAADNDGIPMKKVFSEASDKDNCFFVVSKVHPEHLTVYEARGVDTVALAVYPVCLGMNRGQKVKSGDHRTPESYPGPPFYICSIQDSSAWHHDFGDGRGSILAYGKWFLRLKNPVSTKIGIHGSTGNRVSIREGRGSEGCIRLLDEDIIHLHDNYVTLGTKVIVLPEDAGPLPFETKALEALVNSR